MDDTIIQYGDRTFDIGPPDGITVLRFLRVLGRVGLHAQKLAEAFGIALFQTATPNGESQPATSLTPTLFAFLSAVTDEDLYEMGSAVLQFDSPKQGMDFLKKEGIKLDPLTKALLLNLSQVEDLTRALTNFTGVLPGLTLARIVKTPVEGVG